MTIAEALNDAVDRARAAGQQPEEKLQREYLRVFRALARDVAALFAKITPDTVQAAANWPAPSVDEVLAVAINTARIRDAQRTMLAHIAGTMAGVEGVDFSLTHPVVQDMLDKLGARVEGTVRAGVREPVARAIAEGWARGLSVPDTARSIRAAVTGVLDWQATMLARTDLISLSNGSGNWAAHQLNEGAKANHEPPVIASRTWTSAGDSRVRPSHQEADGQTVPMDQSFTVGGFPLAYPGDPSGPHDEVVNCRCVEIFNEPPPRQGAAPPDDVVLSTRPEEVRVKTKPTERVIPLMFTGPRALINGDRLTIRAAVDPEGRTMWHSDMCFEGVSTGDGRFMVPGSLRSRELPLTLMAMTETPDFGGHAGAEVAGRIDTFDKRDIDMDGAKLPTNVQAVYSTGVFDQGSFAQDIERMVGDEVLRGVSVDLAVFEWAFRDPETGELIDPMEATDEQWERAFMGELEFAVVDGEVMASTVCPTPAFADARIAILASGVSPSFTRTWLAGPEYAALVGVEEGQVMTTIVAAAKPMLVKAARQDTVVASASAAREGIAPLKPNRDLFFVPEPDGPQPIVVDEHGGVTGHLALWETCHTGYSNGSFAECITPPKSGTDYSEFHLMPLVCEDGSQVLVGKLTVGTGHADPHLGIVPARAHYDNTGAVAAFVRAIDGKHGIWLSGCTRSDMTDEQLRDLRVNPPSGDWRGPRGALELLAALAVVCPGFPVPQIGLAADAQGVYMQTLILAAGVGTVDGHIVLDTVDAAVLDAEMNGPEGLDRLIQE